MKPILLLLTVAALMAAASPLQKHALETAIEKADFVGYVTSPRDNHFSANPQILGTEVLKGNVKVLTARSVELSMNSDTEYLLVVSVKDGNASEFHYAVKRKDLLSETELSILNKFPCYSEELRKNPPACLRVLVIGDEVCGCDNNTYSSICEMHQRAILKFRPGKCNQ